MIAVDTNILVFAHRQDATHHRAALDALVGLYAQHGDWVIPWPCLHEFVTVVTRPRVYDPPSTTDEALAVARTVGAQGVRFLGESSRHLDILEQLIADDRVVGPKIHDARIAAICLGHGVEELWTADRDFSYFPELRTRNPLVPR